jgi:uncharacterized phage protein (TIGR02216 family)
LRLERLLGFSVLVLRLPPHAFWRAGFRELRAMLEFLSPAARAPALGDLHALMSRYPDHQPIKGLNDDKP